MSVGSYNRRRGLTLIEIMVAIVIISIAGIGAMGYRYYCVLDARKADVHITASRIGLLILEGWKGASGLDGYDPVSDIDSSMFEDSGVTISGGSSGPAAPSDFTALNSGSYHIVANRANYYATLSYKDQVDKPRAINVSIAWQLGYDTGAVAGSDPSVNLTTYVRN